MALPPVPCSSAALDRQVKRASAVQLDYSNAPIACQVVSRDQAVHNQAPPPLAAKRSRRGRVTISASHHETLGAIKLRLYGPLEIHPANMDVYVRGRLLDADEASLQRLDVSSADVINVVKAERVPNDDYASVVEWQQAMCVAGQLPADRRPPAAPRKERGFVDTILVGGPPAVATGGPPVGIGGAS
jgi:hypothetical protein